jgi:Rap guanine nucleotide exchange factor 1
MYQEAFLTTYRTFIPPHDLIDKLLYRFHKFHHASERKKKVGRNTFSLLIRVIDELRYI